MNFVVSHRLEPVTKALIEVQLGLDLIHRGEVRRKAGVQRIRSEQITSERVNRVDGRVADFRASARTTRTFFGFAVWIERDTLQRFPDSRP